MLFILESKAIYRCDLVTYNQDIDNDDQGSIEPDRISPNLLVEDMNFTCLTTRWSES